MTSLNDLTACVEVEVLQLPMQFTTHQLIIWLAERHPNLYDQALANSPLDVSRRA